MQHKLSNIDFESKRLALDALDITVWFDGENVEIAGFMPTEEVAIVYTQFSPREHNTTIPFSLKIRSPKF